MSPEHKDRDEGARNSHCPGVQVPRVPVRQDTGQSPPSPRLVSHAWSTLRRWFIRVGPSVFALKFNVLPDHLQET